MAGIRETAHCVSRTANVNLDRRVTIEKTRIGEKLREKFPTSFLLASSVLVVRAICGTIVHGSSISYVCIHVYARIKCICKNDNKYIIIYIPVYKTDPPVSIGVKAKDIL